MTNCDNCIHNDDILDWENGTVIFVCLRRHEAPQENCVDFEEIE